jgi:protein-disulfide isomerase
MGLGKKIFYIGLFIEVQILLALLIFLTVKLLEVEQKVERINQFLFNAIQGKEIAALQSIAEDDIVIGDKNAPATMYLYTKFNCSACSEFYGSTYETLQTEYVDKGLLKIIIRYLTHSDNKEVFHAARCAQYAYQNNAFAAYNKLMSPASADLSIAATKETTLTLIPDSTRLTAYLANDKEGEAIFRKAKEARAAGISKTPTIIINGQLLEGNRLFKKLAPLIDADINTHQ